MDIDGEKKRKMAAAAQAGFLADRSFIPVSEDIGTHYVTAMMPPSDEPSDEYYCQINASPKSYQITDCNYEEMDDVNCDPGLDVEDLFNQSLGFVCEEVVLKRRQNERYGITLFYCQNSLDPRLSDIFVGEIEQNSPASAATGMRLGDQVLQINHQDVFTRDQVMHLFSQSSDHIHMLVARSVTQQLQLMTQSRLIPNSSDPYTMVDMQQALDYYETLEDPSSMDALDADSGMGRLTDENLRAEDSSDCSSFHSSRNCPLPPEPNVAYLPDDFIDLDVAKINEELNKLRLQCQYLEKIKAQKESNVVSSFTADSVTKPVPRMGTRLPMKLPSGSSKIEPQFLPQKLNQPVLTFTLPQEAPKDDSPPVLRFNKPPTQKEESEFMSEVQGDVNQQLANEEPKPMQWVVKKRSDGSKYLVKRPVRNQFLRERAKQLAADRQPQSTDDDVASEIKAGKYWTKAERKKQFEKYREYRKQREAIRIQPESVCDQKNNKNRDCNTDQNDLELRVMLTFV